MYFFRRLFFWFSSFGFSRQEQVFVSGGQTLSFLLPEAFHADFEVRKLEDRQTEWRLIAKEKPDRIPEPLRDEKQANIVLNGFEREVEVVSFPLTGKPLYIRFYRRKWKRKGGRESYSNPYEFHPPGMKATKEFGDFLKGLPRPERREFFRAFPHLRHLREEALPVVP